GAVFPLLAECLYSRVSDSLQDKVNARYYTPLPAHSRYSFDEEFPQFSKLVEFGVVGLMLVRATLTPELDSFLRKQKVPYVNTFVYRTDSDAPCIGSDSHAALYQMTEYLIGLGHRRFGMIAQAIAGNDRAQARWEGVHAALAQYGIAIPP